MLKEGQPKIDTPGAKELLEYLGNPPVGDPKLMALVDYADTALGQHYYNVADWYYHLVGSSPVVIDYGTYGPLAQERIRSRMSTVHGYRSAVGRIRELVQTIEDELYENAPFVEDEDAFGQKPEMDPVTDFLSTLAEDLLDKAA